jgi:YHS domain-containing protein
VVFLLLSLAALGQAQPPTTSGGSGEALLNLHNTVAVHGYDVVAYFTQNRPVPGNRRITQRLGMATYYFASRQNRYTFLENAPMYQPQMGGFCATSMAMGRLEDINPSVFLIYRGKLYLFRDEAALDMFLRSPERTIYQASQNYFEMARRHRSIY